MNYFLLYLLTCFMGVALGMLGAGGSILLVPVLVYLLRMNPIKAADYSLFVVGISTSYGVIRSWPIIRPHLKLALQFGIPSITGMSIMRKLLLPLIPEVLIHSSYGILTLKSTIMLLFAISMTIVAKNMIKPSAEVNKIKNIEFDGWLIAVIGLIVGLLSGLLGVGGGFLMVPFFVVFLGLPISESVSVSLLLIAVNCLVGFGSALPIENFDVHLLFFMTLSCWIGMMLGLRFKDKVKADILKVGFGWFIAFVGLLIIIKEVIS